MSTNTKTKRYTHKLFFENGTELVVESTKSFFAAMKTSGVSSKPGEWVLWERSPEPITKRYYYVKGVKGYSSTWREDKGGKLPKALATIRKMPIERPSEVVDFGKSTLTEAQHVDEIQLAVTESGTLTRYKVRNSLFRLRDQRIEPKNLYLVNMIWDIIRKQLRRGEAIQDFTHSWDVNPKKPLEVLHKKDWNGVKDLRHQEILDAEIALQLQIMKDQYKNGKIPETARVEAEGRAKRSAERKLMDDDVNRIFTGQD